LPPRVSDMLAVRIGQLTAEVLHLLDLQPCWLLRCLCHRIPAFPIERDVTNSRVPSLRGCYPTSSLLRTRPPPPRLRSISRFSRLYDLPCSGGFLTGTRGLHQPLDVSLSPCCRFHPAEVGMPHRSDFGIPCSLRPSDAGSALGSPHFRGHICVYCRYGPVTRNLPKGDFVDGLSGLREFSLPPSCHPHYRAPDFCPGRSASC
jgi:hypothetical protein